MTWRIVGFVTAALGGALAVVAVRTGGLAALALWPAAALLIAGAAYFAGSPRLFGKRTDGSLAPLSVGFLFPYLAVTWAIWRAQRATWKRPPSHQIAPGLWLGQRPLPGDLPEGTTLVVDLTCEFAAHPGVLRGPRYLCLPTLDGRAPETTALATLVDAIVAHEGIAYVHCAAGHGRSAVVVACVLVARGLADDGAEALRQVRAVRASIALTSEQRATVGAFRRPVAK